MTSGPRWLATIFVIVWSMVGFYMVLFVAAIKGIPAELFEAARIDGAGRFRTAVRITLPLIRDNVQTAWIYLGILALDAFVYMAALNPGGGPNNSTLVMSQQLLTTAFTKGQFGAGLRHGRHPGGRHPRLRRGGVRRQPAGRRQGGRAVTTTAATPGVTGSTTSEDEPALRKGSSTPKERVFGTVSHIVLIGWAAIVILPMLWTLVTSFKTTSAIISSPF